MSLHALRTECHCGALGAASGTAELLPSPSGSLNWTVGLPTDNGHDSDQIFEFNGTQAVRIPEGVVSVHPEEPFTISVWMRHGPLGKRKEALLCSSDRTGSRCWGGRVLPCPAVAVATSPEVPHASSVCCTGSPVLSVAVTLCSGV